MLAGKIDCTSKTLIMTKTYGYKKPVRRRHPFFKFYLAGAVLMLLAISAAAGFYFLDAKKNNSFVPQSSNIRDTYVSGAVKTFKNADFQFKDDANWVLSAKDSGSGKYTYLQYRGRQIDHQLIVYVNRTPIPLELATARVLPVKIINNNSGLEALTVSEHCVKSYGARELHRVQDKKIQNSLMLCDPDTPSYSVVVSEVGDDYRLKLKKPNGSDVQFVIIYKNQKLNPDAEKLIKITNGFKAV